ncbi:hypothetical protein EJD97_024623, partial [Solanum chilense]
MANKLCFEAFSKILRDILRDRHKYSSDKPFGQKYNDPEYLKEREILTPKYELVHELNDVIMKMILGEVRTYYSCDNVSKASTKTGEEDILYPTKFLNNMRFPRIPNHDIHLKVGIPVMILTN